MASYTTYLELTKPDSSDIIDPRIFSENFDKIDEAITNTVKKTDINELNVTVSEIKNNQALLTESVQNLNTEIGNIGSLIDNVNGEVI